MMEDDDGLQAWCSGRWLTRAATDGEVEWAVGSVAGDDFGRP